MQELSKQNKERLAEYLKKNRQWLRVHRIAFARMMLKFAWAKAEDDAKPTEEVAFWRAVIKAYEI